MAGSQAGKSPRRAVTQAAKIAGSRHVENVRAVDPARPTMRDVADLAGVGITTVSRVVNREGYVARETASRVEGAMLKIGYRRNEIARSMRPGQTSSDLGLLLGKLTNPFFAGVAAAVIAGARERGYVVVLASADEDPGVEQASIDGLLGRRVAGLLIVPGAKDYSYLAGEVELGTPVVFIDRPGRGLEADDVLIDNAAGARLAVQHLAAHGHRRIAIIVAPGTYATAERLRGYRDAMKQLVGGVDDKLVKKLRSGSVDEAERATRELLSSDEPPEAIFTTTSFMTHGALNALDTRSDIALVGFDDFPFAHLLRIPVTVVAGDPDALGALAVQTLFERLDGKVEGPRRRVVKPHLIIRGSGELGPSRQS